jgi:hypothetical protein
MDTNYFLIIAAASTGAKPQVTSPVFQGLDFREISDTVWLVKAPLGTPKELLAKVRSVFPGVTPSIVKLERATLQNAVLAPELATYAGIQAAA